ncbi:MAG: TlpA disulfide reductase family protein [Leeuwenhoekiella sp.]
MQFRFLLVLFTVMLFSSCKKEKSGQNAKISALAATKSDFIVIDSSSISQDVPMYTFEEFQKFLFQDDDKVHVINFWATWCKPCIEEMPSFQKINKEYSEEELALLFVSLDFPKQLETRVKPFLKNKKVKAQVVLLDDPKGNDWIPKVDSTWSGAIPATLIYKGGRRKFYEQSFTYDELKAEVEDFIN